MKQKWSKKNPAVNETKWNVKKNKKKWDDEMNVCIN